MDGKWKPGEKVRGRSSAGVSAGFNGLDLRWFWACLLPMEVVRNRG